MKITYWCDFICPNSYIGLYRLKSAISELNLDVEWDMKAFELKNYSFDSEIEGIAKSEGLEIDLSNLETVNTRNAHRIVKFIQNKYPSQTEDFIEKVFKSYFIEHEDISDINVLNEIADGIEFSIREKYDIEVEIDIEEALFNGITAIPHFIITTGEESLIVPGAFEKDVFKVAIEDMLSGEIKNKTFI